ncbi:hypothetical protein ASC97_05615 [Rhizobium sp. Root1203]|uniref:hypothetical protein n=1 Tax=Rhizobium sp. Root1203 TaxID=1736427 RepID=UPI000708F210|nr:hypothetical protein [Rhizobium sp. Root1203]KQV27844.1 hypothetical protein ASC97_05615 [Rhizobium sp. Root1203]
MPVVKLSAFAGEKPLITPRLLPETAATAAFNTRLNDGALTPTNKSTTTGASSTGPADKTIYRHGDDWLSWSGLVSAAPGPVAADRLYYTGDGAPKMRVGGTVYPLAVQHPIAALTATPSGTGTGDVQSRVYAYTFVTDFGEESAPCPASAVIDWQPGKTVMLSGFAAAPAGRAVTKQRIYRSQSGSSGTYLYFIAERAASASDYVDTVAVDAFQEPLPSANWNEPPDTLQGLVAMPNGMMAAFSGSDVYFCEPFRPHAWPQGYVQTCDFEVVGLRAIGSALVVMTKGQPYLLSGSAPESMQSLKLEANFPCINVRGIVDLSFAICYPSNLGLVAVRADGSISLATQELFDRDAWMAFSPETIIGAQHMGNYVLFYDTLNAKGTRTSGAMMININAAQYLVRSGEVADAVFYSLEDEGLYFKRPSAPGIFRFDSPEGAPETVYWRSKEFWLTQPVNFGAMLIDLGVDTSLKSQANIDAETAAIIAQNTAILATGDLRSSIDGQLINELPLNGDSLIPLPSYEGISVSVYCDGKLVRTEMIAGRITRLPAGFKGRKWEISVSSNVQITQIIIAGTVDELRGAA